jgi:hypothetical protein
MTDLFTFANFLDDLVPSSVELIGGLFFLDRFHRGPTAIASEIATHSSPKEAQQWLNMVPIDDFLDVANPDWSMDDPTLERIKNIYARSWLAGIDARYGKQEGLSVSLLNDHEVGDVVVRLDQK